MYSGVVSDDSLSNILRNISQRRRHGTLDVTLSDRKLKVLFVSGKIVEALENEANPVLEVAKMMQDAGLIAGDLAGELVSTYKTFFLALCENQPEHKVIEEELFRRIVRHRILNKLYSLSGLESGFYTFHNQMVEYDRDFAPNISVGQLLLDLVALQTDAEKFHSVFPAECLIVSAGKVESDGLTNDLTLIMRLAQHGATLDDLERRSMLSRYHLQDGLLTLHAQGLIECRDRSSLPQGIVGEQVLQGLQTSIDNAFDEMANNIAGMDLEKIIDIMPQAAADDSASQPKQAMIRPEMDSAVGQMMAPEMGALNPDSGSLPSGISAMVDPMMDSMSSMLNGGASEQLHEPDALTDLEINSDSSAGMKRPSMPVVKGKESEDLASKVTHGPVIAPPVPPPAVERRGSGRMKVQWSEGWKERRDQLKEYLSLGAESHKLLNSRPLTDGLVFVFICLAVLVPMLAWAKIFQYFGY